MDVDGEKKEGDADGMDVDGDAKEEEEDEKEKKKPEPTKEELSNPARVTPAQERYVRFDEGSRFVPAAADLKRGFVVLKDTTPGEDIEYVAATRTLVPGVTDTGGGAAAAVPAEEEPAAPEEFEFDPTDV